MRIKLNNILQYRKTVQFCAVFWFICLLLIGAPPAAAASYGATPASASSQDTIPAAAAASQDTIHAILPDLEVTQAGRSEFRKSTDGSVKINASDITKLSRSFGEIDFINQIRRLSSVSSNGDYAAGLSIDGADASQAQYLIDGAPVIYPYRFGGIFSTFNTPYFSAMRFMRRSPAELYPVLGSAFSLTTATRFKPGAEGMGNVGMTASSLAVRGGIADRFSVGLAARISYVDQLYGALLKGERNDIKFSFNDLNAFAAWRMSASDQLMLSFFHSGDNVGYEDSYYSLDTKIRWQNNLLNLSYTHQNETGLTLKANTYGSFFKNTLKLTMPQMALTGPSSLKTFGINASASRERLPGFITDWSINGMATLHKAEPQWATLYMADNSLANPEGGRPVRQTLTTVLLSGKLGGWIVKDKLRFTFETALGGFRSVNSVNHSPAAEGNTTYRTLLFTPEASLTYRYASGNVSASAGWRSQPLHQVGFSELGLASNFWLGSCAQAPLQRAFSVAVTNQQRLPWWGLSLETSLYWRHVSNQAEYQGEVMEVIDTDYNALAHLIISDGYNYGASVSLTRNFGAVTGEASYSFGEGRRHSKTDPRDSWAALNAEGHTVKAGVVWHHGRHWEFSGAFRYSSGRRYTPVEALYAIGGNIAMEYGERNSARLPSYQRLDLGATYQFTTGNRHKLKHMVNLSLLNAYGHKNVEMQYFVLNAADGSYSLKRLYSLFRFLPSISYSIEFK